MQVTTDIHKVAQCNVQQLNQSGNITVNYAFDGLFEGTDHWNILGISNDLNFILIYYCGESKVLPQYQGSVIMGRKFAKFTLEHEMYFQNILNESGTQLNLNHFCVNNIEGCTALD